MSKEGATNSIATAQANPIPTLKQYLL